MPEQITKYPDITLQVLRESGAMCGQGAPQKILKQCPRERFCALKGGEICVYGISEIPRMTQISAGELAQVVCPLAPKGASIIPGGLPALEAAILFGGFISGFAMRKLRRERRLAGRMMREEAE